jgi:hypothetical protein
MAFESKQAFERFSAENYVELPVASSGLYAQPSFFAASLSVEELSLDRLEWF